VAARALPSPAQLATLAGCAAAGALGVLPGAGGAFDPVTLLGWLALLAAAAGALCGARGVALLAALSVPATWLLFLSVLSAAQSGPRRELPTPLWAGCALGGLFALGHALGSRARLPFRSAGGLFLLALVLSGAAQGFGLFAGGTELARAHPRLAARLLDVSPLVLAYDCAGHDWIHSQPEVYAAGGVEWIQRRARPGNLAGPAVLVVGCALAVVARRPHPAARAR